MLNKLVSYKGIIHERAEDAPFMGALIIATSCSNGCRGCFNQHLKNAETYMRYADEVIKEVKQIHSMMVLYLAVLNGQNSQTI